MRMLTIGTVLLAAVAIGACRGDAAYDNTIADQSSTGGTTATDGRNAASTAADSVDTSFVQEMATGGTMEVELGQLAQSKGMSAAVKDFGQMMVRDHGQANMELMTVASQLNVSTTPDTSKIQDAREQLSSKSGAEFDRAYIDMMVDDHQHDAGMLQDKVNGSGNAQVKAWASKTLPVVQQHLARAQEIQGSLKK